MITSIDALIAKARRFTNKYHMVFKGTVWRDTHRRLKRLIKSDDIILDIGSLEAPYTKYMSNTCFALDLPVTGRFGFSYDTLEELRANNKNINPLFATADALPFKGQAFDVVICTEVLEHIHNDESAISEISRVMKTEGQLFLTTPNGDVVALEHGIVEHIRHYSEEALNGLLAKYFAKVHIEKRFWLYHQLNVQYRLRESFSKHSLQIWLFVMALISSYMYDAIYFVESLLGRGRYNLVATCSRSRKQRPSLYT